MTDSGLARSIEDALRAEITNRPRETLRALNAMPALREIGVETDAEIGELRTHVDVLTCDEPEATALALRSGEAVDPSFLSAAHVRFVFLFGGETVRVEADGHVSGVLDDTGEVDRVDVSDLLAPM